MSEELNNEKKLASIEQNKSRDYKSKYCGKSGRSARGHGNSPEWLFRKHITKAKNKNLKSVEAKKEIEFIDYPVGVIHNPTKKGCKTFVRIKNKW